MSASELRCRIGEAPNPFVVLLSELADLEASLSLPPPPSMRQASHTLATVRTAFSAAAGSLGHEVNRFALVLTAPPPVDIEAIRAVCWSLVEAAHVVVSALQLAVTAEDRGGVLDATALRLCGGRGACSAEGGVITVAEASPASTFRGFYLSYCHSLLTATKATVQAGQEVVAGLIAFSEGGGRDKGRAVQARAGFVRMAALVERVVGNARQMPATPATAVRRVLLELQQMIKVSGVEVRADHPVVPSAVSPANAAVEAGLVALKALGALCTAGGRVADGVVAGLSAGGGARALTAAEGGTHALIPDLDGFASSARVLQEAVIDIAAAINEAGDPPEEEDEEEGEEEGAGGEDSRAAAAIGRQAHALDEAIVSVRAASAAFTHDIAALAVLLPATGGAEQVRASAEVAPEAGEVVLAALEALEDRTEDFRCTAARE
jgi:hypothetical protein